MTTRFLIGDVFDRMAELPDGSVDLVVTSPPFLALRSYLPADHPDKAKEIGSEATPAVYLDMLLALTAEWRRLLAPHGSIAIELGDTYAGNNGAFDVRPVRGAAGWPLDKSLCGIPHAYMLSLTYGRNILTGEGSLAGLWRVRNYKPWVRSNPPVSALGDKERPATSYVTVATLARDRYFDLDAVRMTSITDLPPVNNNNTKGADDNSKRFTRRVNNAPGGTPPLDWGHHVDAIIDHEINLRPTRIGNHTAGTEDLSGGRGGNWHESAESWASMHGLRGMHIRRALERAGILRTLEALDVSPEHYKGAHYATWPPELVRLLVNEMCPRRVCTTCGQPSRRIVGDAALPFDGQRTRVAPTVGWSDCGCPNHDWRPGLILDPFAGSGTTLAVASGVGRDSIGIDIDERNANLARERVGMFLEVPG